MPRAQTRSSSRRAQRQASRSAVARSAPGRRPTAGPSQPFSQAATACTNLMLASANLLTASAELLMATSELRARDASTIENAEDIGEEIDELTADGIKEEINAGGVKQEIDAGDAWGELIVIEDDDAVEVQARGESTENHTNGGRAAKDAAAQRTSSAESAEEEAEANSNDSNDEDEDSDDGSSWAVDIGGSRYAWVAANRFADDHPAVVRFHETHPEAPVWAERKAVV